MSAVTKKKTSVIVQTLTKNQDLEDYKNLVAIKYDNGDFARDLTEEEEKKLSALETKIENILNEPRCYKCKRTHGEYFCEICQEVHTGCEEHDHS